VSQNKRERERERERERDLKMKTGVEEASCLALSNAICISALLRFLVELNKPPMASCFLLLYSGQERGREAVKSAGQIETKTSGDRCLLPRAVK